ncbi:hypothetical protein GCM10023230_23970 [Flavobacterium hankyongi]|uniref:Uncharacterized protein n=1 Tax=Flavobacterium hankyongi TaxID=1176532 RepID=A0ABP9A341_9FLAO
MKKAKKSNPKAKIILLLFESFCIFLKLWKTIKTEVIQIPKTGVYSNLSPIVVPINVMIFVAKVMVIKKKIIANEITEHFFL